LLLQDPQLGTKEDSRNRIGISQEQKTLLSPAVILQGISFHVTRHKKPKEIVEFRGLKQRVKFSNKENEMIT
jgi:hypothetical protein